MKLYEIKNIHESFPKNSDVALYRMQENPTVEEFMETLGIPDYAWSYKKTFTHLERIDVTDGGDVNVPDTILTQPQQGVGVFPYSWGRIGGDFSVYTASKGTGIGLKEFDGPTEVRGGFKVDRFLGTDLTDGPHIVTGEYVINEAGNLTSMKGLPSEVGGSLELYYAEKLADFDHLPKSIGGNLLIHHGKGVSLVGIADKLHEMEGSVAMFWSDIKEGGLGLFNIKGCTGLSEGLQDLTGPWAIINKHFANDTGIFACQQELIEADYEAYAQL